MITRTKYVAFVAALGLLAGCTPRQSLHVERPTVASPIACEVTRQNAWSADEMRAGSPRFEGNVELIAARGDERLRHAGHSVASWSGDGKSLVSASAETVIVWDPVTGEPRHSVSLGQDPGVVSAIAVSATAAQVALAVSRRGVSTQLLLLVRPQQDAIRVLSHAAPPRLRFSDDEARLIGAQQVWDVASGKRVWGARSFSGAASHMLSEVVQPSRERHSPTTRAFAQWLDDARTGIEIRREGAKLILERWIPERSERTTIATFDDPPAGQTVGHALSPSGRFFVAIENGQVRRWSLLDGSFQRFAAPRVDWRGKDIALSNDGASLAFWTRRLKDSPLGLRGPVFEFYPPTPLNGFQAPCLGQGCGDTSVHLWELAKGAERWAQPHAGSRLVFAPGDTLMMRPPSAYGSSKVIDVERGATFAHHGQLTAIHPPSGRALARRGRHAPRIVQLGSERSWPLRTRASEQLIQRSSAGATVTRDEQGRVRLRTADRCFVLANPLNDARFSDDGRWLFGVDYSSACKSKTSRGLGLSCPAARVVAWDAEAGDVKGALVIAAPANSVRVLPNSAEVLVSGSRAAASLVRLFDMPSQQAARTGPRGSASAAQLPSGGPPSALGSVWQQSTRDGRYLFGVRRAHHLSLWDRHGGPAVDLPLRRGMPRLMTLSADNRYAALVPERSNSVRWWRLPDQEAITGPDFGAVVDIDSLHFNHSSSTLAVVKRKAVHLVDVASGTRAGVVDLRPRYDRVQLVTWTGPRVLTIDTERGVQIVVRQTATAAASR